MGYHIHAESASLYGRSNDIMVPVPPNLHICGLGKGSQQVHWFLTGRRQHEVEPLPAS